MPPPSEPDDGKLLGRGSGEGLACMSGGPIYLRGARARNADPRRPARGFQSTISCDLWGRNLPSAAIRTKTCVEEHAMPFEDRSDAGRRLAEALLRYRDQRPIVLALPRGGVAVAAEVATALDAPLDLILVRKIGVPTQPELAMGAVVDGGNPVVVRNADVIRLTGVTESEFKAICDSE